MDEATRRETAAVRDRALKRLEGRPAAVPFLRNLPLAKVAAVLETIRAVRSDPPRPRSD